MNDNSILVILSPGFPENECDTACLPPKQVFIRALNQCFPQLAIVIISFQYPYRAGEYSWNGNKVIALGGKNRGNFFRLLTWWRARRILSSLQREYRIIGLLSFWCTESALVGKRFANKHHLRHFCWISGQDAKKENHYVKKIRPAEEELVAMSDFLVKNFQLNHQLRPSHRIPIGILKEDFTAPQQDRIYDLIGAGSLIALKQFTVFIEVVKALKKQIPGIRSILFGEGPERKNLQHLIETYQLQDHICLAGEKPHSEVIEIMQRSKILLHPSSYEGFGSVCIEALAAGAQVISFVQPMDSWIHHWHIAGDTAQMIQMAACILQDPDTRFEPSVPFDMLDSARKMMTLFEFN